MHSLLKFVYGRRGSLVYLRSRFVKMGSSNGLLCGLHSHSIALEISLLFVVLLCKNRDPSPSPNLASQNKQVTQELKAARNKIFVLISLPSCILLCNHSARVVYIGKCARPVSNVFCVYEAVFWREVLSFLL